MIPQRYVTAKYHSPLPFFVFRIAMLQCRGVGCAWNLWIDRLFLEVAGDSRHRHGDHMRSPPMKEQYILSILSQRWDQRSHASLGICWISISFHAFRLPRLYIVDLTTRYNRTVIWRKTYLVEVISSGSSPSYGGANTARAKTHGTHLLKV